MRRTKHLGFCTVKSIHHVEHSRASIRAQFDDIAKKLSISRQQDWYKTSADTISKIEVGGFTPALKERTLHATLRYVYPEFEWNEWCFQQAPIDIWRDKEVRKRYVDWLAEELGIHTQEEWYLTCNNHFASNYGSRMLQKHYGSSFITALKSLYHQYDWKIWLFEVCPHKFWTKDSNRKQYMDWLAEQLGVECQQDWYNVQASALRQRGGIAFLNKFTGEAEGTLCNALEKVYPQYCWYPWLFATLPHKIWENQSIRKTFFEWLEEESDVRTQHDLYYLDISQLVPITVDTRTAHTPLEFTLLKEAFPQYEWFPWLLPNCPKKFWSVEKHRREYMDWLADILGIETQEQWYHVSISDFEFNGGNEILQYHGWSFISAVSSAYPEFTWHGDNFVNEDWYNKTLSPLQLRRLLDKAAEQLDVEFQHQWYHVSMAQIRRFVVGMKETIHSLVQLLSTAYPEYTWHGWLFPHAPSEYWRDFDNHKKFFDWAAYELNIMKKEDWYKVKYSDITSLGGLSLLHNYYGGSFMNALKIIYPEEEWCLWLFQTAPLKFWNDENNIKAFMNWLTKELDINKPEDWYQVSYTKIRNLGGSSLLQRYNLPTLLKFHIPDYNWNFDTFVPYEKTQRVMINCVKSLLSQYDDIHTTYKHPQLIFPGTSLQMELDVFIPSISLAFEYQGEQHYCTTNIFGLLEKRQQQDEEKREACRARGITLIEVPYWWDMKKDSIAATIHKYRPDIIPNPPKAQPIPEQNPFADKVEEINLAARKRAHYYNGFQIPVTVDVPSNESASMNKWWLLPVEDGMTAAWDGQMFHFRNGRSVVPPAHVFSNLPKGPLLFGCLSIK